ncbi:hypothetical protein QJQ45_015730, partial [Haematococcus lacustris]
EASRGAESAGLGSGLTPYRLQGPAVVQLGFPAAAAAHSGPLNPSSPRLVPGALPQQQRQQQQQEGHGQGVMVLEQAVPPPDQAAGPSTPAAPSSQARPPPLALTTSPSGTPPQAADTAAGQAAVSPPTGHAGYGLGLNPGLGPATRTPPLPTPLPSPTPPSPLLLPPHSPPGSQLAAELAALEAEEEAAEQQQGREARQGAELRCCVCHEGYSLQPSQLLCVYLFCKAVPYTWSQADGRDSLEPGQEARAGARRGGQGRRALGRGGAGPGRVTPGAGAEPVQGAGSSTGVCQGEAGVVGGVTALAGAEARAALSTAAWEAGLTTVGGPPMCMLPANSPCRALYTSVTYFNVIHAACHAAARRADASLRTPKKEWDGASLRNGEVRCNMLLPLPGLRLPETALEEGLAAHWEALQALGPCLDTPSRPSSRSNAASSSNASTSSNGVHAAARAVGASMSQDSIGGAGLGMQAEGEAEAGLKLQRMMLEEGPGLRLILMAADMASLLFRFAARQSFSNDCGGGGRESNAALMPCLLPLALYFHEHCNPEQRTVLRAYVDSHAVPAEPSPPQASPIATPAPISHPTSSLPSVSPDPDPSSTSQSRAHQTTSTLEGWRQWHGVTTLQGPAPQSWPHALALSLVTHSAPGLWLSYRAVALHRLLWAVGAGRPEGNRSAAMEDSAGASSVNKLASGSNSSDSRRQVLDLTIEPSSPAATLAPGSSSPSRGADMGLAAREFEYVADRPSQGVLVALRFFSLVDCLHAYMHHHQQQQHGNDSLAWQHQQPQMVEQLQERHRFSQEGGQAQERWRARLSACGLSTPHQAHALAQALLARVQELERASGSSQAMLSRGSRVKWCGVLLPAARYGCKQRGSLLTEEPLAPSTQCLARREQARLQARQPHLVRVHRGEDVDQLRCERALLLEGGAGGAGGRA